MTVPGRNPGTSTKVTRGMLKASQNLTNLAPFTDELMSKQPSQQHQKTDTNSYLVTMVTTQLNYVTKYMKPSLWTQYKYTGSSYAAYC